ncbi:hypothetical protein KM043_004660 [Ampulex compressa]|nr:hypothetical protein KM043_004660 [Ampulex compressa]
MKAKGELKEFEVIGRKLPTEKEKTTPLYKMRIFAPDAIVAKSRFWYFLRQLKKFKKSTGEIVSLKQIPEKTPVKVKNFGIWLRYDSRSGTHNMYREYRDLSVSGAVTQCYRDMGARHRARAHSIQIIKVEVVKAANCRRPQVKQFHDSKIRFPLPKRIQHRNHQEVAHLCLSYKTTENGTMNKIMGIFHDKTITPRIPFDEESDNGFILGSVYIPKELLMEIFCYVDYKTLLSCQLVCKHWKILIQSYIWRKRAELTLGQLLPAIKDIPWSNYYMICKKKPFGRNLLKNHSGEYGIKQNWKILRQRGHKWIIENPPVGVPALPAEEPVFEGKQYCFVTSFDECTKMQTIDLEPEGLTPYILDNLQPVIVASEWYSCRFDCPATYECFVELQGINNEVLDSFQFRDEIEGDRQNQWHHVSHEFKNYGPGLRKISFYDGGKDRSFWAGHYGSKMAGACISINESFFDISKRNIQDPLIKLKKV